MLLRSLGTVGQVGTHLEIAQASLRDQIYRLRSHPSMLMWLNGSDNPPPPNVEEMYLKDRERPAVAEPDRLVGDGETDLSDRRKRRQDVGSV